MHFSFSKPLILLLLLISLSGCSNVEAIYKDGKSMLTETLKSDPSESMNPQLQAVDRATDRGAARNKLARELIGDSDRTCEKQLGKIADNAEGWRINSDSPGDMGKKLDSAISKRQFDIADPATTLMALSSSADAGKALGKALVETIQRHRNKARIELNNRMEAGISHYSLKQVLMDIRAYHNTCTTAFGINQLAGSSHRLSPEEKQAAIDSLMQMRKQLMQEGMNPRSIQRKIDDIILAE